MMPIQIEIIILNGNCNNVISDNPKDHFIQIMVVCIYDALENNFGIKK